LKLNNPLGSKRRDISASVCPEPSTTLRTKGIVEGHALTELVVRQAHHERSNGQSGLKLLRDIRCIVFFYALCGVMLMAWSVQEVWAESATNIESQIRLSQWLNMKLNSAQQSSNLSSDGKPFTPYLPGLVWMVPEEAQEQSRMKSQLLESLKAENLVSGVSRADAMKLASFVESLPVTGRVVVEKTDPRWLEVNPTHDPVLHEGQRILIPSRPTSVTVVRGDGHICQVAHSVLSFALEYVRQCDATLAPKIAWIVQPDGLVQRRGVAGWNEDEQDPPAPGAWIVTDDPATPWSTTILERLARLLATQGVAGDKDVSQILPQPAIQHEFITGQPDRPRNLTLSTSLMQTPTARMENVGEASLNLHHVWPYTDLNADVQPLDWLEVGYGYSDFANHPYGSASLSGSQTYKDKSLDVKLKLSDESAFMPQMAIGVEDLLGTGLRAGEYVVASKRTGNLDWSLGLGWGYLGARGNFGNPFSLLSSSFSTRQGVGGSSGQVNISSLFTGPTALFGGVQYQTPWDPLLLKLELDGNNYQHEPFGNNLKQTSPINVGMVYRWLPAVDLSMSWERGTTLGLGVSYHGDLSKFTTPKLFDPKPEKVSPIYPTEEPDWNKVAALLEEKTSWRVLEIRRAGSEVIVRFERADAMYWDAYIDRIASVLHRYVPSRSIMVFRIQSADYGLGLHEYLIDRQAWVEAKTGFIPAHLVQNTVFEQPESKGFIYPLSDTLLDRPSKQFDGKFGIDYNQMLGGPNGFLLYQIGVGGLVNWYWQPNTWWTGSLDYRLIDNYDKFTYDAPSNLPRVRTDIREYVETARVTMPVFQFTHVDKLNNENFYSVYGGMLETMFGGVGAEWLYRPWQSTVGFGVDVNEVKQRGFAQDFSFLDPQYSVMTGHASLYWEGIDDINVTLRAGRYLAGDKGATLEISRVFKNGVKVGAFATKTNISAAQFGEGSFDKGIYLDIPFDTFLMRSSADVAHIMYHPLLRDGGAILSRQFPLWNLTAKQGGDMLKWHPFGDERKTQFGDVPDNFSDISHDSVFTAAGKDLTEFGRTATTPDFWRSMLMIGGISLASAILDKPLDKLAVKHGNNGVVKDVAKLGSDLPFVVMGAAGMAFLANDQDSGLAKTSYSSLAAGGEGFMASLALKYMVGRARPTAEQGATSFTPVSKSNSNSSWPSMHSTVMWAAVTPYAKEYDASWLYGVAAVTNVARVAGRNHWFSDTVAGSLLGYAIGDFVWSSHNTKKHGTNWAVSPNGVTAYWKIE
jgi:membrane-associated phospholipid phosphatase